MCCCDEDFTIAEIFIFIYLLFARVVNIYEYHKYFVYGEVCLSNNIESRKY